MLHVNRHHDGGRNDVVGVVDTPLGLASFFGSRIWIKRNSQKTKVFLFVKTLLGGEKSYDKIIDSRVGETFLTICIGMVK